MVGPLDELHMWSFIDLITGNANQKLLLSILKVQDVKVDFEAVAKALSTDGVTCTPRAVQEQLKKLKKVANQNIE